MKMIDLN